MAFPGPLVGLGHGWGRGVSNPSCPSALLQSVLNSGIDQKLQGQLNTLRFRALLRPERLQTAPQSLGSLRCSDLWCPLTQKSPQGDRWAWEGATPPPAAPAPTSPPRLAGKNGQSNSAETRSTPTPDRKTGGRWNPAAARRGCPGHLLTPRHLLASACERLSQSSESVSPATHTNASASFSSSTLNCLSGGC